MPVDGPATVSPECPVNAEYVSSSVDYTVGVSATSSGNSTSNGAESSYCSLV